MPTSNTLLDGESVLRVELQRLRTTYSTIVQEIDSVKSEFVRLQEQKGVLESSIANLERDIERLKEQSQ